MYDTAFLILHFQVSYRASLKTQVFARFPIVLSFQPSLIIFRYFIKIVKHVNRSRMRRFQISELLINRNDRFNIGC